MRQVSEDGVALIKSFESLRLAAYDDATGDVLAAGEKAVGRATIGYGHTNGVTAGEMCTAAQAEEWLRADLAPAAGAVEADVKVPLNDNQFAALSSFVFNVGSAAFKASTLLKLLNAGKYDVVPQQLARWNRARGTVLAGLTRRRAAEAALWAKKPVGATPDEEGAAAQFVDRPPRFAHLITLGGITLGAAASALSDCAAQLQPLSDDGQALKYLFLSVTVMGAALAMAARLGTLHKEGV